MVVLARPQAQSFTTASLQTATKLLQVIPASQKQDSLLADGVVTTALERSSPDNQFRGQMLMSSAPQYGPHQLFSCRITLVLVPEPCQQPKPD